MIGPPSAYLRNPRLTLTLNIASYTYTPKQQKNLSSDMDLPPRNKPFKKNEINPSPL
jgi:hypothetical protein